MYEEILSILSKGGFVLLPIFLVAQAGWFFTVERLFFLKKMSGSQDKFWKRISRDRHSLLTESPVVENMPGGMFGMIVDRVMKINDRNSTSITLAAREVIDEIVPGMQRHLSTISVMAASAPLLGLLGTVTGMIATFQIIMQYGIGNPAMMAEGISEALLTTEAGLVAGFPLLLMHNYLLNKADAIESECVSGTARLVNILG